MTKAKCETNQRIDQIPVEYDEAESDYITIVFRNGDVAHYKPEEYDDYRYDRKFFIVIKDKRWIGFYNLDCVEYIEIS